MKTNIKEINSYTRQLDILIEWEKIKEDFDKEYKKARLSFSMPGFRKGKVPDKIVKQNLGPSIEANFAENSINIYYKKALVDLEIVPINQASIDKLDFKEGSDLSFSARFEVNPDVVLPKYQKIKINAVRYRPENEDVDQALENYREQHATIKIIESGAKSGHFIRADFQVLGIDGLPDATKKLDDQYIRLGFGMFKGEIEKVFLNKKEGEQVSVVMESKEGPITYNVTIKRVEEQVLPALDDELAKTINEKFSSLSDLKTQIKEDLQLSLDKDHKDLIRKEIINYFIDNSKLDAPESMVSMYLEHIKQDLEKKNQPYQEGDLENNYKSHAEWNIKWYLIKDKLIEKESLDVTDNELDDKINKIILENKSSEAEINSFYKEANNRQNLYNEIMNDKLFDYLLDYTKVKVVEKSTNEIRKQKK